MIQLGKLINDLMGFCDAHPNAWTGKALGALGMLWLMLKVFTPKAAIAEAQAGRLEMRGDALQMFSRRATIATEADKAAAAKL